MLTVKYVSVVLLLTVFQLIKCKSSKPNIILIVADDLGWNDVGFHGSNQLRTSNIDALAYHGLILNRHYVLPTCTPSRASLMTGKYAIRTGLQGDPGSPSAPWALPISEKILPQYLKNLDYKTHLVGKWHLGFYRQEFTPTRRGFDTHFGYYNGWVRYNDSVSRTPNGVGGFDARRNLQPAAGEVSGKYLTNVYTEEAIKIIENHNPEQPLFLEISHVAVHATNDWPNNLQVADKAENDRKFSYIKDEYRRLYAGVLDSLDQSVGQVITALHESNLLKNSIIIFMSDNGGPTIDPVWNFTNTASNWPLRGMKTSFFDGGVRGLLAMWSPLLKYRHGVFHELFHISDWLPTLITAAGGSIQNGQDLDGINQWHYLIGEQPKSDRKEILVNIDHRKGLYGIILGKWKLIHCNTSHKPSFADVYDGIPGREDSEIAYQMDSVIHSAANKVLSQYSSSDKNIRELFDRVRQSATMDEACHKRIAAGRTPPVEQCQQNLLFDLEDDPCEFHNIREQAPSIVKSLKARLQYFELQTMAMQIFPSDSNADPSRFGGYWSWWLDYHPELSCMVVVSSGLAILVAFGLCKIR